MPSGTGTQDVHLLPGSSHGPISKSSKQRQCLPANNTLTFREERSPRLPAKQMEILYIIYFKNIYAEVILLKNIVPKTAKESLKCLFLVDVVEQNSG